MAAKDIGKVKANTDLLLGNVAPEVEGGEAMRRSIIERNLAADNDDDLFAEQVSIATKDIVGLGIQVEDIRLAEGEVDGEATTYMLIDAINLDTGERMLVNSGAPQVTSKLWNLKNRGRLPIQVFVAEAAPARKGRNAVLTLRRVANQMKVPDPPKA